MPAVARWVAEGIFVPRGPPGWLNFKLKTNKKKKSTKFTQAHQAGTPENVIPNTHLWLATPLALLRT